MDVDTEISDRAIQYAKDNRKEIVEKQLAGLESTENLLSIFMAGSPGAGKTETSKELIKDVGNLLRIDADELRKEFPEYGDENSHLFQRATTRLVHDVHNAALKKNFSFIMDGTFAVQSIAYQNIERSLKRGREIQILFVYQDPKIAWEFIEKRRIETKRNVPQDVFIKKFCDARIVANKIKETFGEQIALHLIIKNLDYTNMDVIGDIKSLEKHLPSSHTETTLRALLGKR